MQGWGRRAAWSRLSAGAVFVAAALLVADGQAGQANRSTRIDFDPAKKGTWRFLDDDLGELLEQGRAAYEKKDYVTAARSYLAYLYRNGRDSRTLYELARCYSRLGDAEAAVAVLTRAVTNGFVHPELLEADEGFAPIRDTRVFKDHSRKIAGLRGRLGRTIGVIGPRVNRCKVRLPATQLPGKTYPLVVGLHGNGSSGGDMMLTLTAEAFPGMICAAPDGAYIRDDLSFRPNEHFSWYMPGMERALWPTIDPPTTDYVLAAVEEIARTCPVSQVILFGFSQGASVAYTVALKHPERISGVVAVGGVFPREAVSQSEIEAGRGVRVLIGHGSDDSVVDRRHSERARDLLKEAGYRVQFETFEGGHTVPPDMIQRAGAWIRDWR